MNDRALASRGGPWNRLFATNLTQAQATFVSGGLVEKAFASPFADGTNLKIISLDRIPVAERPDFVTGEETPNSIEFAFFGTDTNNQTFSARIWGITQGLGTVGTTATKTWRPTLLAQILATIGNVQGVAGGLIAATDFFCDTHALTYGASADYVAGDTTDVRGAHCRIDHLGMPLIGVELDDGGSAVTVNGLYRFLW